MLELKKKTYIKPSVIGVRLQSVQLIALSPQDSIEINNDNKDQFEHLGRENHHSNVWENEW